MTAEKFSLLVGVLTMTSRRERRDIVRMAYTCCNRRPRVWRASTSASSSAT
jgi:hypothetical protein